MVIGAREHRVLVIVARFSLCGGGQLAGRAQLWYRLVDRGCWIVLLVEPVCVDTQKGKMQCFCLRRMSMTMEQVVSQLQQELFTLRAQVAAESGLADAVRAINSLATAQVRKDTPRLIDVQGLGRPKEFSGREEDFHLRSQKTEAFFPGVIKESEMMLEWAAEQTIKNHDDSYRSRVPAERSECGQRSAKPGVGVAADADSAHGSHEL